MKRVVMSMVLMSCISILCGNMTRGHQAGSAAASGLLGGAKAAATGTSPSTVPGFVTGNPKEASLDDGSIGGATMAAARENPAATMISEQSGTRKKYVIDPNTDPVMINANRAYANPESTMEEMVMETPAGSADEDEIHECMEGGDEYQQSCHKRLVVKIQVTPSKTVFSHEEEEIDRSTCQYANDYNNDGSICIVHSYHPRIRIYKTTPRKVEILSEEWVDSCGALEAQSDEGLCRYEAEIIGGRETKTITGPVVGLPTATDSEPITRDSWEKTYTYSCLKQVEGTCDALRSKGCLQIGSECAETIGGVCVAWKQIFKCPSNKRKVRLYRAVGEKTPFCLTGDCTNSDYEANGEMLNAMSQMAILKEAQNDIRANVGIFKGQIRKCSKNCVGFRDCCTTGKGWGVSLHLSSCSGEEKELADWRAKKRCVFVGTYCAEKILGICTRKKSSFCCFGNKLSRLLNDQGRRQLGIGFGDAESLDCRGLTPEELSRIDMSQMNLSELYEDVQANFKPKAHTAQGAELERIKENMAQMTRRVKLPPAEGPVSISSTHNEGTSL